MNTLLDTNICIALIQNRSVAARRRLRFAETGSVVLSAVVFFELKSGAFGSARVDENLAALSRFVSRVPVVDFDEGDAAEAARIRVDLHRTGRPIGPYDTLIAGQARARGLVLATNNVREFSRVPGLVVEDWLAAL